MKNKSVKDHFDKISSEYDAWKRKNRYYARGLESIIKKYVRPGSRVMEIGCATGDMLDSASPSRGVGIDISAEMIKIAQAKYPRYDFICTDLEGLDLSEKFDFILMIDLIDHVSDLVSLLRAVRKFCHPTTKIIVTTINPWWEPVLSLMEKVRAKMPEGPHNFVEKRNLAKIIDFMDLSIVCSGYALLFPKYIPVLSFLANTLGTRIWGINKLSFVQYMILHPDPLNHTDLGKGCSVIIPCYNEEENIEEAVSRVPDMGKRTEIIVVDDGSTDNTRAKVQQMIREGKEIELVHYDDNRGKGYAVQKGFESAREDILMILDADMSVPPEELPIFFELLNKGLCDFVNGTRMLYPMEDQAMRFFNLLGNKIFSLLLTFISGQHLTDTLCGTKAFFKKDLDSFKMGYDRWGDYDLIFGAAKTGLRIMEMPVHYGARKADLSKMKTFTHGLHLLRITLRAFREIVLKF